ncbi:MAG: DUF5615 family PIN-like protein [Cyanobacteriota bacterium]|nr:DUF5615 family PIN-like protein [Cyanobacteriota bacterium]
MNNIFAKVYFDEDVSVLVATLLVARGLNAGTARDQGMLSESDDRQLAYAAATNRCLVTHNRLDFEKLHAQYLNNNRLHFGIVIASRKSPYEIAKRVAILLDTFTADEIANQLFYV